MKPIFFYGTLRDPALCEIVLGRSVAAGELIEAVAPGYRAVAVADQAYPALLPDEEARAPGVLLLDPSETDAARLAFFEEAEYGLEPIAVETAEGPKLAQYYRSTEKLSPLAEEWDLAAWERCEATVARIAAAEVMTHFGTLAVEDIDTVWPGIMRRAYQRARAAEEAPVAGRLRTVRGTDDFEIVNRRVAHAAFLAVEQAELRHRTYAGGPMRALARETVAWGDAVTVLPYDPRRDRVLLIEQFRAGPAMRGDPNPWSVEVVAGLMDKPETPEACARREAAEEAGLRLGRLEFIVRHYPAPGLVAEHLYAFVGEADLPALGPVGLHGVAEEGEDIRAFVVPLDVAVAAADAGEIGNAPALLSVHWLARHADRLRSLWAETA